MSPSPPHARTASVRAQRPRERRPSPISPLSPLARAEARVAGAVDRAFAERVLIKTPRDADARQKIEELRAFAERWNEPRLLRDADAFFGPAAAPSLADSGWRRTAEVGPGGLIVEKTSFPSPHRVHFAPIAERWRGFDTNRRVTVRRVRAPVVGTRPPGRTAIIVVHGYMAGNLTLEPWIWPTRRFARLGMDAVFVALPFHGPRNDRAFGPPRWPGRHMMWALEGFRQAVADLRALVSRLEAEGYDHVGMTGMSLGGFTTALMATVDERLAFAMPYIPLASFADWSRDAGQLGDDESTREELYHWLEESHALVSPFTRPARIPANRILVGGGVRDAVTPIGHAERIADHFDAELVRFRGGHLLQVGRRAVFDAFVEMARREGLAT